MKNCPHCGAEVRGESQFCPNCGETIPKGSNVPRWLGFTAFLLVLVIGFTLYFSVLQPKIQASREAEPETESETTTVTETTTDLLGFQDGVYTTGELTELFDAGQSSAVAGETLQISGNFYLYESSYFTLDPAGSSVIFHCDFGNNSVKQKAQELDTGDSVVIYGTVTEVGRYGYTITVNSLESVG